MADYLPTLLIPHRQWYRLPVLHVVACPVDCAVMLTRTLRSEVGLFAQPQLVALKYESDHVRWTVLTRA
ncbi:TPA: hypothetical protein VB894_000538 [Streptococcus suis]|nr:hypothetical protein [Streptococcus suis]